MESSDFSISAKIRDCRPLAGLIARIRREIGANCGPVTGLSPPRSMAGHSSCTIDRA